MINQINRRKSPSVPAQLARAAMMILLFLGSAGLAIGLGYFAMASPAFESGGMPIKAAQAMTQMLFFALAALAIGVFVIALLDCWSSESDQATKIVWLVVMFLAPVVGSLLWFAVGRQLAERAPERRAA